MKRGALGAPVAWLLGGGGTGVGARAAQLLALVGAALGLAAGLAVLFGAATLDFNHPWPMPFGAIHLRLDLLAALFLVMTLAMVLVVFAARTIDAGAQGWFNLLIGSLVAVILARNITLFLVAWEMMAVTSFLLIASGPDADTAEGQEGAWSYL